MPGEKPLGAKTRSNNKLDPQIIPGTGIEPPTLVGGECSHHYVIPASQSPGRYRGINSNEYVRRPFGVPICNPRTFGGLGILQ